MRHLLLLLSLLLLSLLASGQDLLKGLRHSPYTYIYALTNQQARQAYADELQEFDPGYLQQLVDSFPTRRTYLKPLPPGNYLYVHAQEEQLVLQLQGVRTVSLSLIPDPRKLLAAIHTPHGELVTHAPVRIDGKAMRYQTQTRLYQRRYRSGYKLLEVEHQGISNFFALEQAYGRYTLGRTLLRKVLRFKPVNLLYRPVQQVVHSIRWGETQGWLRLFDPSLDWEERLGGEKQFAGYLALNQPTYRPGDTVYYKAFALKKRRAFKKPLQLELWGSTRAGYKTYSLGTVTPYRKGGYSGYFILHDTLGLLLDTYPTLSLRHKRHVLEQQFKVEDYELRGNTFTLSASSDNWVAGNAPLLLMRATDVNGLPLLGAEVELLALVDAVTELSGQTRLTVPDTLWRHKQLLEPAAETQLQLPDSIFYPAAMRYSLYATLKTPQQEYLRQQLSGQYHPQQLLDLHLQADSLHLRWLQKGVSVPQKVTLLLSLADGQELEQEVVLPHSLKVDPLWEQVEAGRAGMWQSLQLGSKPALVAHTTRRTADSLQIRFSSGRRLPYWYAIYQGKKHKRKIASGYSPGEPLLWQRKAGRNEAYYVQLSYVWGGQVHKEQEQIPLLKKLLRIALEAPETVSPGQQLELGLQVTNYRGKPVKGVDVTAFAYNKQLPGSMEPAVPYLGREKQYPFAMKHPREELLQVKEKSSLDWQSWRQRLGLDSIAFYQFLFPQKGVFSYTLPTPDSSTQLAPFVVEKGVPQQVHVVYLNDVPVYYSEVATTRAYSFMVNPEKRYKLSLRTAHQLITLDSLRFEKGRKTILSLEKGVQQPGIRVEEMLSQLSPAELNRLNNYLIVVNHSYNPYYTYLEQDDQVQLLGTPSGAQYTQQLLAGPFRTGSLQYQVLDDFKTRFVVEPGYQYRISPQLVFAKATKPLQEGTWLRQERMTPLFEEVALTEPRVRQLWQQYLQQKNTRPILYEYPKSTPAGAGRLGITYSWDSTTWQQKQPQLSQVVVLGLQDSAFVQVYPVNQPLPHASQLLHHLPPGRYRLLGLLSDSTYLRADSLLVKAHATTYLDLQQLQPQPQDAYIRHMRGLMEKSSSSRVSSDKRQEQELGYINQLGRMQARSAGTQLLQGQVVDASDGIGLPGVAVTIKGTTIGTITDMEGNYSLYTYAGDVLVFSFVGYAAVEAEAGHKSRLDIVLSEDIEQLQEVIVTGYAEISQKEMSFSYALEGKVAGVAISLRGDSSFSTATEPLIIIDGVPYSGDRSALDAALVASAIIMKGEEATAIYGSRAAAGVILITTGQSVPRPQGEMAALTGVSSQQQSLRSHFRDWAFWQPRLLTDARGRASFTARFPDDVTAWEAQLLAIGGRQHSGYSSQSIRAVKSLWAALAMPRFLLSGDSALVMGQVNNHSQDTLPVRTLFTVDGRPRGGSNALLTSSLRDSAWVSPPHTDSLTLTYELLNQQGLLDGERRQLPVYRKGVREASGAFMVLRPDSASRLKLAPSENPWQLQAFASRREPLLREAHSILDFAYYCNEQAASKLYALLLLNSARQEQDQPPRQQALIKRLIRQLEETQRPQDGLWGWWQTNRGEYWISRHVLGALQLARQQGYTVTYDPALLQRGLRWQLQGSRHPYEQLQLLEVLSQLKTPAVPYQELIPVLEDSLEQDELGRLRLLRLRAAVGMPFTTEAVLALKHETMLGAYYWGSEGGLDPRHTSLVATAWAYDLLHQLGATEAMDKAELYLWANRPGGSWRNTYESAQVLLQLMPLLQLQQQDEAILELKAFGQTHYYTELPLRKPVGLPAAEVHLKNTGNTPLYLSATTERWLEAPEAAGTDFQITTRFTDNQKLLRRGQAVSLIATVVVKKAAEYVMIEIPIPAGCTYEDTGRNRNEMHREYYRDRVVIFCRSLPEGEHEFSISLQPRFKGLYTLNPAQVSLMYFPAFFGRTSLKQVEIR